MSADVVPLEPRRLADVIPFPRHDTVTTDGSDGGEAGEELCEARDATYWPALHLHEVYGTPCGLATLCEPCRDDHQRACSACGEVERECLDDSVFDPCEGA